MSDHANDLDELLDSALDDFQNLNIAAPAKRGEHVAAEKKEAAAAALPEVKGLGLGLPALNSSKKGKQKISKGSHVSEALDKLKEQTQETVRGLESVTVGKDGGDNLGKDATMEDWVKQFEELAGSQDMESIVETMMQQLLSKEILYEPMKEISERYPKWLEEHGAGLSQLDHDRFSHQHGLIKDLIAVYENDSANFTKIVEIMQKMQECGQPPNDIVQELAPDFDLANLGQLSPDERSNCSIM